MTRENPYEVPQIHSSTSTFTDVTSFALGATGIVFDQNGGISSIKTSVFPDSGRTSTAAQYTGNFGFSGEAAFYYDGPQITSSATVAIGGISYSYAYWARIGGAIAYCNTGGGAMMSFQRNVDATWPWGARVVPRDSYSDSSGRHPQKLFTRIDSFVDPDNLFAEFRGNVTVETAGLPDPSSKYQPGRLWGNADCNFANGSVYASGATGITFPQEGGIQWLFAALRPDFNTGQGAAEQLGNMNVAGILKFFYDGPVVSSTSTVSIASETWNYAYEKDIAFTMFCITNAGHWEIKEASDLNKRFDKPFRIVDRDNHSGGAQRIHIRADFEDPWDSASDKVRFNVNVATAKYDPYNNFKAS